MRHRFLAAVIVVVVAAAALVSAQTQPAPPRFEVDPFWPKPLPNRWLMGQAAGVAVDRGTTSGCPAAAHADRGREGRRAVAAAQRVLPARAFRHGVRLEGNFLQTGGAPARATVAGERARHHRRRSGQRMARRQRPQGWDDLEVHQGWQARDDHRPARPGGQRLRDRASAPPVERRRRHCASEIFVADGYGNHRVIVFDTGTGAYKRHWGANGRPPGDASVKGFGNPVHCAGCPGTACSTCATGSTTASRSSIRTARS